MGSSLSLSTVTCSWSIHLLCLRARDLQETLPTAEALHSRTNCLQAPEMGTTASSATALGSAKAWFIFQASWAQKEVGMDVSYHSQHAVFSSDYQEEGVFFLNYETTRRKKGRWGGTALISSLDPDRGTCQTFVRVLMKVCVTCICFPGRQTCLFCIWFDAADEEWVGSTKCGHQGMERILKNSRQNPKDHSLQEGKWLHLMQ